LDKDVADRLLDRAGVSKRLEERKDQLNQTVTRLIDCYKCYHGSGIEQIQIELLQKLLRDIIRVDPIIASFYYSHADKFGLTDLESFGGVISKKITERIIRDNIQQGLIKKTVNQL
jgi:hypothetical protein